jgi:K+-transporting ATPase KdpF subunit
MSDIDAGRALHRGMDSSNVVALVITLSTIGYLVYALLRPERF